MAFMHRLASTLNKWGEYRDLSPEQNEHLLTADMSIEHLEEANAYGVSEKNQSSCSIYCLKSTFWPKTATIVLAALLLWQTPKYAWLVFAEPNSCVIRPPLSEHSAVQPPTTDLENMPAFNTTLGCSHANYADNLTLMFPIGETEAEHTLETRGDASGTMLIAQGLPTATHVVYEVTIRANSKPLLSRVEFAAQSQEATANQSKVLFITPHIRTDDSRRDCMRFDVTIYVPPNLRKLHIAAKTALHVQFDSAARIRLDELSIKLLQAHTSNMLITSTSVVARVTALQLSHGWLIGELALGERTRLLTQHGDAVTNLRLRPWHNPQHPDGSRPVDLQTVTGAGRSEFFYINDSRYPHRRISSTHMSLKGGDLYLTYKDAAYRGNVDLMAHTYSAAGLRRAFSREGEDQGKPWVGDRLGRDEMKIRSPKGWVGLLF